MKDSKSSLPSTATQKHTHPIAKKIASALLVASVGLSSIASAQALNVKTYNPGEKAIFPVSSSLIYGSKDAILVDAQFQKQYAKQVIDMVKESGKNLKYVFISHNDPDYYFGLDEIKKAFPNAQVISTAQTAYLIDSSKDAKRVVWKDKLGKDAPEELFTPTAYTATKIEIDGEEIDIRQDKSTGAHAYLWIPSLKTILGGVSVSEGGHLWMADSQSVQDIDHWISILSDMQALKPASVIPGHYIHNSTDPKILAFTKHYLEDYKKALINTKSSSGIITAMEKNYPKLPGKDSLEFSAKVSTGEIPWQVASAYPPIGKTAQVNFDGTIFNLHFKDNKTMSLEGTAGTFNGISDSVEYTAIEISKNIFMVYWHEPAVGANVVHVQDWNLGSVYTNISGKDGSFTHLKGTIKIK